MGSPTLRDRAREAGLTIAWDTREQTPWTFGGELPLVKTTLQTGDYSLVGYESLITVERKSMKDYLSSIHQERFHNEIDRMVVFPYAWIVTEGAFDEFMNPFRKYGGNTASLYGRSASIIVKRRVPIINGGTRASAELTALALMLTAWDALQNEKPPAEGPGACERKKL